jgi:UDP-hydrolysing UDP-N-acetyl-D-glucosamine 2-epimerase
MKIAVISGSRADAGPLQAVVTALFAAGHKPDFISMDLGKGDQTRADTGSTTAIVLTHLSNVFGYNNDAELVLLLGDRHEVLGAAVAAYLLGKPIAHLSGGDITEGSQDDSMRHAITKLSHLHFVTNDESRSRVIQMGEEPWRVHTVGCPGVDGIADTSHDKAGVQRAVGLPETDRKLILVVYHPNTLNDPQQREAGHLRTALWEFEECDIVLIGPNTDAGNWTIKQQNASLVSQMSNVVSFETVQRDLYLGLLKHADVLVGNSSSGFYEAPTFGTPVVNIGDRQLGRIEATNITTVPAQSWDIIKAINDALQSAKYSPSNPYGDGTAAKKIAAIISEIKHPPALLRKKFHDIRPALGGGPQNEGLGKVSLGAASQVGAQDMGSFITGGTVWGQMSGYRVWTGGVKPVSGS